MTNLTIVNLENCFRSAIDSGYNYVAVKVYMEGFESEEVIVNPLENAEEKLEYYKEAYNNDLTHKQAGDKIRITGFTFGDSFEDIEMDFFEYATVSKVVLRDEE